MSASPSPSPHPSRQNTPSRPRSSYDALSQELLGARERQRSAELDREALSRANVLNDELVSQTTHSDRESSELRQRIAQQQQELSGLRVALLAATDEASKPDLAAEQKVREMSKIVRVRTPEAMLRIDCTTQDTVRVLRQKVAERLSRAPGSIELKTPPPRSQALQDTASFYALGMQNGDLVYASFCDQGAISHEMPESFRVPHEGDRMILADEDLSSDSSADESENKPRCSHPPTMTCPNCAPRERYVPVRPRCPNHPPNGWCTACEEYRKALMPHLQSQETRKCKKIHVNSRAGQGFQQFLQQFGKVMMRMGLLYGRENDDKTVTVEVIYEPPQEGTPDGIVPLPDPNSARVDQLASQLGLKKIGWIFSHRKRNYSMSAAEMLYATALQREVGKRCVTLSAQVEDDGSIEIVGYQVSRQAVRLLRRGTLSEEPADETRVQTTEPCIVEMKETTVVDVEFFLVTTPIVYYDDSKFASAFPVENRPRHTRMLDLKEHLLRCTGMPFHRTVSDFHLLLFLMSESDPEIVAQLCEVVNAQSDARFPALSMLLQALAGIE